MCSQSFCVLPLHQNKKILNRSAWSTQAFKSHYYFFSSLGLSAQGWVRGPVVEQKQVQSCFSQHGLHGPFPGIQWIQLMWIQYWDLLFPSMIGWWSFSYIPAGIFHSCFSELCQQKLLTRMYFPSGWGQVTLSTVMRFLLLLCGYWGFWLLSLPGWVPICAYVWQVWSQLPCTVVRRLTLQGQGSVCLPRTLNVLVGFETVSEGSFRNWHV